MNLKEYLATANLGQGLPQGDTVLELDKIELEDVKATFDGKERIRTKMKTQDGKDFFIPFSIVRNLQNFSINGVNKVRITRTGTTKTDTRYTIVEVK